MADPTDPKPAAAGCLLSLAILIGATIGMFLRQPSPASSAARPSASPSRSSTALRSAADRGVGYPVGLAIARAQVQG